MINPLIYTSQLKDAKNNSLLQAIFFFKKNKTECTSLSNNNRVEMSVLFILGFPKVKIHSGNRGIVLGDPGNRGGTNFIPRGIGE